MFWMREKLAVLVLSLVLLDACSISLPALSVVGVF